MPSVTPLRSQSAPHPSQTLSSRRKSFIVCLQAYFCRSGLELISGRAARAAVVMRRHAPEAGSSFGPCRAQVRTPVFLVSATFLPRKCFQPPQYCCSLRHPAEKTEATTRHGYKREKNRMSMDFSCVWLPWFAGESRRIRQERTWYFQDNSSFIRLCKVTRYPNRVGVCFQPSWASSSISFWVRRDFLHCLPVDGGNCREYKTAQRAFQEVQLCTLEPPPSPPHPSHT
jgi:hypothetical protein